MISHPKRFVHFNNPLIIGGATKTLYIYIVESRAGATYINLDEQLQQSAGEGPADCQPATKSERPPNRTLTTFRLNISFGLGYSTYFSKRTQLYKFPYLSSCIGLFWYKKKLNQRVGHAYVYILGQDLGKTSSAKHGSSID